MNGMKNKAIKKQIQIGVISVSIGICSMMIIIIIINLYLFAQTTYSSFITYFDDIEKKHIEEVYEFANSMRNLIESLLIKSTIIPFNYLLKLDNDLKSQFVNSPFMQYIQISSNNSLVCWEYCCIFYSQEINSTLRNKIGVDFSDSQHLPPLINHLISQRLHDKKTFKNMFLNSYFVNRFNNESFFISMNSPIKEINFYELSNFTDQFLKNITRFYSKINITINDDLFKDVTFLNLNLNFSNLQQFNNQKIFSYIFYYKLSDFGYDFGIDFPETTVGDIMSSLSDYFMGIDVLYYFNMNNSTFTDLTCNRIKYLKQKRNNLASNEIINLINNDISDCFLNNQSYQLQALNDYMGQNFDTIFKFPLMKSDFYDNQHVDFYYKISKFNLISGYYTFNRQLYQNGTDSKIYVIKSIEGIDTKKDFIYFNVSIFFFSVLMFNLVIWVLILILIFINILRIVNLFCEPLDQITSLVNSIGKSEQNNSEKSTKSKHFSNDEDLNELHYLTKGLIEGFNNKGFKSKNDEDETTELNDLETISKIKINNILIKDELINSDKDENKIFYYSRIKENQDKIDDLNLLYYRNEECSVDLLTKFISNEKLNEIEKKLGTDNIFYDLINDSIFDD